MSETIDAINLGELEALARAVLPRMAYDYYAGGANDEIIASAREPGRTLRRIAMLLPRAG